MIPRKEERAVLVTVESEVGSAVNFHVTKHSILSFALDITGSRMVMRSFLLFRGSQPGLFYDLSTGESLPPPHSLRQAQGCGFPH